MFAIERSHEFEKLERDRLLSMRGQLRTQQFFDGMKIADLSNEIRMNQEMLSGFETASFIHRSRSEYQSVFVDEMRKLLEKQRQSRSEVLHERLRELQHQLDELDRHKTEFVRVHEDLRKARQQYDLQVKERLKYDKNIKSKSQLEA